jgi:hypothetical protein
MRQGEHEDNGSQLHGKRGDLGYAGFFGLGAGGAHEFPIDIAGEEAGAGD